MKHTRSRPGILPYVAVVKAAGSIRGDDMGTIKQSSHRRLASQVKLGVARLRVLAASTRAMHPDTEAALERLKYALWSVQQSRGLAAELAAATGRPCLVVREGGGG